MLAESYEAAKNLLAENRDVMDKIAEFLIEKETITGKEFMKIFRELKGIPEPEEETPEKAEEVNEESSETTFEEVAMENNTEESVEDKEVVPADSNEQTESDNKNDETTEES